MKISPEFGCLPQTPGLFLMSGAEHSGVICIQNNRFPVQADIHILSRDRFQVIGHIEVDPNALQAVPQDLADRVKIPGKLVHIGGCAVAGIVEAHMRHTLMPILRLLWVTPV